MPDLAVVFAALVYLPLASLSRMDGFKSHPDEALELIDPQPYFVPTPTSYTYEVGQTAVLQCAVKNLGDKQVIWRKTSDTSPLTVGLESFYNTDRIVVRNTPRDHKWNLLIRRVQVSDDGVYECQVSSRYRHLRQLVLLNVKEKEETTFIPSKDIKVSGSPYVEKGEEIYLVCNATDQKHWPATIDWFFNGNKISSIPNKIRVTISATVATGTITSHLRVMNAQLSDSGVYVCRTTILHIADMRVTVLNSDSFNVKRGTISGQKDKDPRYEHSPGKQDGYSSSVDKRNSAHTQNLAMNHHLLVLTTVVIAVARYWLFPS